MQACRRWAMTASNEATSRASSAGFLQRGEITTWLPTTMPARRSLSRQRARNSSSSWAPLVKQTTVHLSIVRRPISETMRSLIASRELRIAAP